jgi:hypothetical protein
MQSRLAQMCTILIENEFVPLTDARLEHALEAVRDLTLMEFVFDHMKEDDRTDDEFIRRMRQVIDDSILPQNDQQQSVGRNAQFELYIHALCRSAELTPVTFGEPDVRCNVRGITFGIAAKRIKSLSKLKDRVTEAADQIQKSRLPGIIAIDTCIALNPTNQRITIKIPDDEFGAMWNEALRQFTFDNYDWIQENVRGKGVRGIVIHDHQVRWKDEADWELVGMTYWIPTTRENKRRAREAAWFYDAYQRGLPNLVTQ